MTTRRRPLDPGKAFLHVIYEHRYLALAAGATERFGLPSSNPAAIGRANDLLPGIGVVLRDSLLLHARNLIEFYTHPRRAGLHPATGKRVKRDAYVSNILLVDFSIPIPPRSTCEAMQKYSAPISVHLGHLTAYRDTDFRAAAVNDYDKERYRPDWDIDTVPLVDSIFTALAHAACSPGAWSAAFRELGKACVPVRIDPTAGWPQYLGEKPEVEKWLQGLNLL